METGNKRVDSRCFPAADGKVIDQIMLRFRPIAPRPVNGPISGYALPERKRVKRKYVRVKNMKNKKNNKDTSMINDNKSWLDLDRTVSMLEDSKRDPSQNWISFDFPGNKRKSMINDLLSSDLDLHGVDERKVVETWITMESVTGTCEDRRMLGYTDEEIWKNLEGDTCPGFMSNGCDEVQWVNPAYRSMVDLSCDGGEVVVWLEVKVDKSMVVKYLPAFSCIVRIEYCSSKKKTQMMVPCDVCKMDSGGFAWRLDVEFALSLGLSS